jgi:phage terminase Nu1 subunit (DNA packaging protein)
MTTSATDILTDIDLVIDLIGKLVANIAAAKAVLGSDQLGEAKARLATVQAQGAALDSAFDRALAAATADPG